MLLDGILERNRVFVAGREPRPLAAPERLRLAVVGCYDPRLDPILPPALGLTAENAILLRVAGALVRPEGDPLRSLALAAYLFGVEEILVVGHSSCRMTAFSSAAFIDAFRPRGVTREAFGAADLREWAGAIPDPARGVRASVQSIAAAPFLPADLTIAGLVLDDTTGALEVIVPPATRGTAASAPIAEPAGPPAAAPPPEAAPPAGAAGPPGATSTPRAGQRVPPPRAVDLPPDVVREIEAIRSFVTTLEASAGWRDQLARLRAELASQPRAGARLALIEKFLRRSTVNARGVATAFERLKTQTAAAIRGPALERLVDLFRPSGGLRKP